MHRGSFVLRHAACDRFDRSDVFQVIVHCDADERLVALARFEGDDPFLCAFKSSGVRKVRRGFQSGNVTVFSRCGVLPHRQAGQPIGFEVYAQPFVAAGIPQQ